MSKLSKLNDRFVKRSRNWFETSERLRAAKTVHDQNVWRFIRAFVRYAKAAELKTPKQFLAALKVVAPFIEARTQSRYARVTRAVVRHKPAGVKLKDWVRSQGGLARCG